MHAPYSFLRIARKKDKTKGKISLQFFFRLVFRRFSVLFLKVVWQKVRFYYVTRLPIVLGCINISFSLLDKHSRSRRLVWLPTLVTPSVPLLLASRPTKVGLRLGPMGPVTFGYIGYVIALEFPNLEARESARACPLGRLPYVA